ncbi:MAG TPA: molybdopterin-dependent oxidoreductase, partial [Chthoniobacterales bacterium]
MTHAVSSDESPRADSGFASRIRTTCPRDCYDSCGIVADRRTGRLRILGDPDHAIARGALCQKCAVAYNSVWLDPARRLRHPLRRVGAKGEGRFEAVSWEEAIADIAGRLKALAVRGEARRIIQTHYTGTFSWIAFWFPWRFFNRLGCTEVDPDTICNKAGHVALNYVLGDSLMGFDPRQARAAKAILIWGANPSHSAPHLHEHWLGEFAGPKIVIDPIRHATAEKADLHLQLHPGS